MVDPRPMKRLVLLGSTGSVGENTIRLIDAQRDRFTLTGLAARTQGKRLLEQARSFGVSVIALTDPDSAEAIRPAASASGVRVIDGPDAPVALLREVEFDRVVHGITGAAGLPASHECLRQGRDLALANKESLVIAGAMLVDLARRTGAEIIPVDSEHSAIFQCVRREPRRAIRRIFLTGSGGPFRDRAPATFGAITPAEALCHPNWSMGERITVGSATMMNKAFEIVEAHHLFGLPLDRIRVLIHRQSIVHSMVELEDASMLAQMGIPDMRIPIQVALHHPDRGPIDLDPFDPTRFAQLTFEEPDHARYPALRLGGRCIELGGTAGAVLNAADEVATRRFLDGEIRFPDIARLCAEALASLVEPECSSLEDVHRADERAREFVRSRIAAIVS